MISHVRWPGHFYPVAPAAVMRPIFSGSEFRKPQRAIGNGKPDCLIMLSSVPRRNSSCKGMGTVAVLSRVRFCMTA
jgi:hypothetical protein